MKIDIEVRRDDCGSIDIGLCRKRAEQLYRETILELAGACFGSDLQLSTQRPTQDAKSTREEYHADRNPHAHAFGRKLAVRACR
ncbi:hypothetical protein [Bradyrhizobium sp. CCGUVB23]|uniref:hypothetical protein n=1 Tax=Bradyrhizobium sp. CCGUVB23 TaxID=2949630 RepID=UPI0020B381B1|nr:hypothetical protein [Bradyrhizobium sp. CCGUVB23]MCP3462942.1 hypothetical protein [Bradyrhizobium sp. CCGUVB23]